MKLFILGGRRGVGAHLVTQALEQGHEVTALARNPDAITQKHERLKVQKGDAMNAEVLAGAMRGQDVVLSSLGATNLRNVTLYSESGKHLIAAMEQAGV